MNRRLIVSLMVMIFWTTSFMGCKSSTTQPTQPDHLGLQLSLLNGQVQEAFINQNTYIKGYLYDDYGQAQRGVKVNFTLEPNNLADITPYGYTEPDSASGFSTSVTFIGRTEGVVLLRGYVLDNLYREVASDTIHILIKRGQW